MDQQIRFCATSDGVRIAYATVGQGPPLVKAANWLTHLEFDWQSPVWRHLFAALAENHSLIRYDERGTGLSDRHVEDLSLQGWVRDLEAVVDALDLERFALLGISQGGPTAVQYTVRHPERVSHLILYGSFARWPKAMADVEPSVLGAVRGGWGQDNPAYRQLLTTLFIPDASLEQMQWFNELERVSASPETAGEILQQIWQTDVSEISPLLKTPTMVIHRKGDAAVLFEAGRELAALIPNASFVPLEGNNHYILEQDPEFETFLDTVEQFLGGTAVRRRKVPRGLEKTAPSFRSFASGRYVVRRLLGEGGQKTVFLGRDTQLDRDVAIALLKTEGLDEASVARVRKEARTMAGLGAQPHIVTIFDIGEEEARPYIVSEYVPGGELRQELARGGRPLPLERALAITKDLCRALAFAHSQGIVHRDVKPDNVWLARDGTAKLGDFGLALGTDRSRLTMAGTVMGTAAYMAPEQAAGTEVDGRTDLYSLGCLLYEALSGRPPFVGDNALAVISQHARVPPARPSDYNPAVPRGLDRLTLQLLAKAKEDRPASAEQALAELERVAAECLQQPARLDEARGREQG